MERITLRDAYQRQIGYIEVESNGDKVLRDDYQRVLGYYYAGDNTTRDEYRRLIGYGDLLTTLLPR